MHQENGSILVVTVVIMVLLTIIGFAAMSTTNIELKIAANDRDYKQHFYVADGGMNKEFMLTTNYPIKLTKAEQYTHVPYYIVINGSYTTNDTNSTDTSIVNGTTHTVGPDVYEYAIKFLKRKQAIKKGEGSNVDFIHYEINTKSPNSVSLESEGFLRTMSY